MKKVLSFVMAMVVLVSLVGTVLAAEGAFTPSVTAKPAPEIVVKNEAKVEADDNATTDAVVEAPVIEVVEIKESQEVQVETFEVIHVEVTPVAEKDEEHVEEEVKVALTEAFEVLSAPEVKLAEVMPELETVIADAAKEDASLKTVTANDLVVKDLFNIAVSDQLAKALEVEGNAVKLTFDAKIAKNQFVAVMVCVDGKWIPVDFIVNEDGTITCTMDVVGVVAILVNP